VKLRRQWDWEARGEEEHPARQLDEEKTRGSLTM